MNTFIVIESQVKVTILKFRLYYYEFWPDFVSLVGSAGVSLLDCFAVLFYPYFRLISFLYISICMYYEGHPINRENFLIMQEFVPLKHRKSNHYVA